MKHMDASSKHRNLNMEARSDACLNFISHYLNFDGNRHELKAVPESSLHRSDTYSA